MDENDKEEVERDQLITRGAVKQYLANSDAENLNNGIEEK